MKFALSLLIAAIILPSAHGFLFRLIFGLFLQPLLDTACTAAQTALKLQETTNCACTGEYVGLGRGFEGDVKCTLKQTPCLQPPDKFCVQGELGAGLSFGLFGGAGFGSNIEGCFDVKSGLPAGVGSIEKFCLTMIPSGLKLGSCTAKIGNDQCNSCDICNEGTGFKFDCSDVNIAPSLPIAIPGPKVANCIGLGLTGALPIGNSTNATRF